MNWDAVGAVGELLGATAVLVTLAYLSVQVRQNARSLDQQNRFAAAEMLQRRADALLQLGMLVGSEENFPIWMKITAAECVKPDQFDPAERARAAFLLMTLRGNLENTFLQYKQGLIPEDFYRSVAVRNTEMIGPALVAFDVPMEPSFRQEVDRILASKDSS